MGRCFPFPSTPLLSPYLHQTSDQAVQENSPLLVVMPHLIPVSSSAIGDPLPITCCVNAVSSSPLTGPQFPHPYKKWVGPVDFSGLFQSYDS